MSGRATLLYLSRRPLVLQIGECPSVESPTDTHTAAPKRPSLGLLRKRNAEEAGLASPSGGPYVAATSISNTWWQSYIYSSLALKEQWIVTQNKISEDDSASIHSACRAALALVDPLLPHISDIKLVRNQRKNLINVRIKNQYMKIINHLLISIEGFYICTRPVYTMEPYVQVFVLNRSSGEREKIRADHYLKYVAPFVSDFLKKFELKDATFTSTLPSLGSSGSPAPEYPSLKEYLDSLGLHSSPSDGDSGSADAIAAAPERLVPLSLFVKIPLGMYQQKMAILTPIDEVEEASNVIAESVHDKAKFGVLKDSLDSVNCYLRTILDINNSPSGNKVEINKNYVPTLFAVEKSGCLFGFYASDKLEPYVIITALAPEGGKIFKLTTAQLNHLVDAITEFKRKFGISNEMYHYTPVSERQETDRFVNTGGADLKSKAHSTHFHLKLRIASAMYADTTSVLKLINFNRIKSELEPVRYNYNRESVDWATALAAMKVDCCDY